MAHAGPRVGRSKEEAEAAQSSAETHAPMAEAEASGAVSTVAAKVQPHVQMAEAAVSAVVEAMVAEAWKAEEMVAASSKAEAEDCVTCFPPACASPSISRMETMSLSLSLSQSSHHCRSLRITVAVFAYVWIWIECVRVARFFNSYRSGQFLEWIPDHVARVLVKQAAL
jgi:hypothetical protein